MANITDATNAYGAALKQAQKGGGMEAPGADGGSFADLVKNSLQGAIEAQHTSEKVSAAGLTGKADMTQVLQAVTEAEMSLKMVMAIRDKVVDAYERIMTTPV